MNRILVFLCEKDVDILDNDKEHFGTFILWIGRLYRVIIN